jgi:hypothetical protein
MKKIIAVKINIHGRYNVMFRITILLLLFNIIYKYMSKAENNNIRAIGNTILIIF